MRYVCRWSCTGLGTLQRVFFSIWPGLSIRGFDHRSEEAAKKALATAGTCRELLDTSELPFRRPVRPRVFKLLIVP